MSANVQTDHCIAQRPNQPLDLDYNEYSADRVRLIV